MTPATLEEKAVLRRLLEVYKYDFSEFDDDLDECGLFGYCCLDHGWTEPRCCRRTPAPARARSFRAAHVPPARPRRRGEPPGLLPVPWSLEVREIAENLPAQAFWRQEIGDYTGGDYREVTLDNADSRGPLRSFASCAAPTAQTIGKATTQPAQPISPRRTT